MSIFDISNPNSNTSTPLLNCVNSYFAKLKTEPFPTCCCGCGFGPQPPSPPPPPPDDAFDAFFPVRSDEGGWLALPVCARGRRYLYTMYIMYIPCTHHVERVDLGVFRGVLEVYIWCIYMYNGVYIGVKYGIL